MGIKFLKIGISMYLLGLLVFYTYAVFDTLAWDIAYFGWAKIADAGILMWGALYFNLKPQYRDTVKWIFIFSFIRLLIDIQSYFTGIGVNNEFIVAFIFLVLIVIVATLSIKELKKL